MASQKVKGLSIVLSADTTAVSSALGEVNKSLNSTQKELNQVDKLLKLDPKNTTLLTQKQELLAKSINDTKEKLNQLNKVRELADKDDSVDKQSKQYRELIQQIVKAEQQLKGYNSQLNITNDNLEKSGSSALNFGSILKANITSDVIIGGVKALASAFKEVGSAIADVVVDSAGYADEVNTLAKQYNLSTKQIQQYKSASELIDVEFNTIAKSMSKLTKNMNNPSNSVASAFKELGIKVRDSKGELRDSNEVFNETIEALGKIENETKQDAVAMEIFGKSASDLGPLINGGAEQLQEFNKYLEENNLLLSNDELNSLNDIQDGFDVFNATIDGIKNKIGVELAPTLKPILDAINQFIVDNKDKIIEVVNKILEWLQSDEAKEFFGLVSNLVDDVIELITNVATLIDDVGILDGAWNFVKETIKAISDIIDHINDIITGEAWRNGTLFSGGWNDMSEFGGVPSNPNLPYSGGYGALQSGGYNTINLTASFNVNGQLDEANARAYARIMAEQINEELGQMV